MANIKINTFQGIAPKTDSRLLSESQGQIGENLRLTSGSLQSWRESVVDSIPAKPGILSSIYLYTGYGTDRWLAWTTDVDVVKAPISNDTTERIYFTGDGKPKAADNAVDTVTGIDGPAGNSQYPENSVTLGVPAPTAAPTVAVGVGGAGATPVDFTIYVYTFVTQWGEESAPSPASALIQIDFDGTGSVDLSAMEITIPAEYNTLDKVRIYRSLSGTNSTAYQFVAEITPSATHTDALPGTSLGEVISSTDYDLAPIDMFGIIDAGNGVLVGFTKYEICFCEPYQPHAWPIKYRLAVVSAIVGGGLFGNTLVVGTDDQPVLCTGNHPSAMTMTIHPDHQACVSKRGIVSMKGKVIYPSPDGLYWIGYGGSGLLTVHLYDRETWQERNPDQLFATQWDTRYIGFTDTKGIVIEMATDPASAGDFNLLIDSVYTDPKNDRLFVCERTLAGVSEIKLFNSGGVRIPYKWRSKKFSLDSQVTFTAGRILAKYGALLTASELAALQQLIADIIAANIANSRGELNGHAVNVFPVNGSLFVTPPTAPVAQNIVMRVYGDGALISTTTINNDSPFRLPSGGRHKQFEIEIETFTDINQITLASSISDLK